MASFTEHYGLHQWVPEDDFLRADFNTDLQKIDQALNEIAKTAGGKISIVTGSYTGDGVDGRTITLGFQPTAVYICTNCGVAGYSTGSFYCYGGLLLQDSPLINEGVTAAEMCDDGFQIYKPNGYIRINLSGTIYHYIAYR